jgi:hypothetical protein
MTEVMAKTMTEVMAEIMTAVLAETTTKAMVETAVLLLLTVVLHAALVPPIRITGMMTMIGNQAC